MAYRFDTATAAPEGPGFPGTGVILCPIGHFIMFLILYSYLSPKKSQQLGDTNPQRF